MSFSEILLEPVIYYHSFHGDFKSYFRTYRLNVHYEQFTNIHHIKIYPLTRSVTIKCSIYTYACIADIQTKSELPTLLHFGARYGLANFCTTLLAFPGGRKALRIKNKDGKTPYKLAIYSGHTSLANNTLVRSFAN